MALIDRYSRQTLFPGIGEEGQKQLSNSSVAIIGCGALEISNRVVAEALGGLPPVKMHCSVLAGDALKSAIEDYLNKNKLKEEQK